MKFSRNIRIFISLTLTFCILTLSSCSFTDNGSFHKFTEELFRKEICSDTLTMHFTLTDPLSYGIGEYKVSLANPYSKDKASELKSLKRKLKHFSHSRLYGQDAITRDVLTSYVDTQLSLSDYSFYEDPLLPRGGNASQLPLLLSEYHFLDVQDVNDYLALLSQVSDYLGKLLEFEEEKARKGLFMSDSQCQTTITQLEKFIEHPEENCLLSTFQERISKLDISDQQKQSYIEKNQSIFTQTIIPAYQSLISGLTSLIGRGRNDLGVCFYPNGKEYYRLLVKGDTGCSDSMENLNKRIEEARNNDFAVSANLIASNPGLLELCESYECDFSEDEQMLDTLSEEMLRDFPAPPEDTSCEISYVDPSMEEYLAPAFYITAPLDNYLENTIYINSAASYPDISYFTTVAHESIPGHLYQTVMSYEYGYDDVRALLDFPGYVEGWATYVEMISYGYAGLDKDLSTLLMRNQAATLSLYASSDIGMHYYGWNMKDLADFWKDYGVTDDNVIKEIAGLILSDPGNYLKYYVGYLEFMDLRQSLMDKYKDDFSVKAFHEAVLRIGPAPFDTIRKYLDTYYCNAYASQS